MLTGRKPADDLICVAGVFFNRKTIVEQQASVRAGAVIVVHLGPAGHTVRRDKVDPLRRAKPRDAGVWAVIEHVRKGHQTAAALCSSVCILRDIVRGRGDCAGGAGENVRGHHLALWSERLIACQCMNGERSIFTPAIPNRGGSESSALTAERTDRVRRVEWNNVRIPFVLRLRGAPFLAASRREAGREPS